MSGIKSNPEQFQALQNNPSQDPFVMLNLLEFKPDGKNNNFANKPWSRPCCMPRTAVQARTVAGI
jgi:hypothetical protein